MLQRACVQLLQVPQLPGKHTLSSEPQPALSFTPNPNFPQFWGIVQINHCVRIYIIKSKGFLNGVGLTPLSCSCRLWCHSDRLIRRFCRATYLDAQVKHTRAQAGCVHTQITSSCLLSSSQEPVAALVTGLHG